jgi:hypothetical protein
VAFATSSPEPIEKLLRDLIITNAGGESSANNIMPKTTIFNLIYEHKIEHIDVSA